MIIFPYPKSTKCYGDTVIRRYGVQCLMEEALLKIFRQFCPFCPWN